MVVSLPLLCGPQTLILCFHARREACLSMTPKQILDSFSETLMQDERILSARERALLSSLLQHARAAAGENPETQEAVSTAIASAVGETVAQRAFTVLGGSVLERILKNNPSSLNDVAATRRSEIYAREPQPPGHGPGPGIPLREPQPPGSPLRTPGEPQPPGHGPGPGVPLREPQPPGSPLRTPGEPQPPGHGPGPGIPVRPPQPPRSAETTVTSETSVAIADRPETLPAKCVVLDEFLAPRELEDLTRFTVEHEAAFSASEVISPTADSGVINYEHRRSSVLMDLAQHQDMMVERIKAVLPQVLHKLGMEEFSIAGVEVQVTASNDGDFFRFHSDNGSDRVASRYLTFVYFFHREPRRFDGGELRIRDTRLEGDAYVSEGSYQSIVPQQNQIVFFPCELLHEITPVKCPSGLFADSRFTLNGWLRR